MVAFPHNKPEAQKWLEKAMSEKHTPFSRLPWEVHTNLLGEPDIYAQGGLNPVAMVDEDCHFIVEAVNNHDRLKAENERLREALEEAVEVIKQDLVDIGPCPNHQRR